MVSRIFVFTFLLGLLPALSHSFDGLAVDIGQDKDDGVNFCRTAFQLDTPYSWFDKKKWNVDLFFEFSFMHFESDSTPEKQPSRSENLQAISITPVFRLQRSPKSGGVIPYLKLAVGAAFFSEKNLHSKKRGRIDFGSTFQFEDILAAGLRFGSRYQFDLSVKYIHYSNFGFSEYNDGIDLTCISFGYRF